MAMSNLGTYAELRNYFENDRIFKITTNQDDFIKSLLKIYEESAYSAARLARNAMQRPASENLLEAHKAEIMVGLIESILSNMCCDECDGDAVLSFIKESTESTLNL